ncbi:hypothetical protein JCM10213_002211 [Rhodosporidiobolus nylandii]
MAPTIRTHASSLDFLQATAAADLARTNVLTGFIFERWLKAATTLVASAGDEDVKKPDEDAQVLVSVWEGDELRLMFSKLGLAQCKLVSPLRPSQHSTLAVPFMPQLVDHLLAMPPFSTLPSLLRSITGPTLLVDSFLTAWPHPRKTRPSMEMLACSTTSAPPPASLPAGHTFERIRDVFALSQTEVEHLAELLIGFFAGAETAPKLSVAEAVASLHKSVPAGAMWVYRAPAQSAPGNVPVGFVTTGRPTLRTVAIRGVFVAPSHRGQGIAARMVSLVTRAHLVEAPKLPLDLGKPLPTTEDGAPVEEGKTKWGGKDEVCLFVEPDNLPARRAYAKVGFRESEDKWCDVDLEGVEPGSW